LDASLSARVRRTAASAGYGGASAAALHRFPFLSQYLDKLIYERGRYVKPIFARIATQPVNDLFAPRLV
jgi:hypothetical protein